VKCGGVDALHAAFLDESRTRGRLLGPRTGNPGISLVFREMWDFHERKLTTLTSLTNLKLYGRPGTQADLRFYLRHSWLWFLEPEGESPAQQD
jgi:hypothetical protein